MTWRARVADTVLPGALLVTRAKVEADGVPPVARMLAERVVTTDFSGSSKSAAPAVAALGQHVNFVLKAVNSGADARDVLLTDALPRGLDFVSGSASSSAGPPPEWDAVSSSLQWRGRLGGREAVEVRFAAVMRTEVSQRNVMQLWDGVDSRFAAWALVAPLRTRVYLPTVTPAAPARQYD